MKNTALKQCKNNSLTSKERGIRIYILNKFNQMFSHEKVTSN